MITCNGAGGDRIKYSGKVFDRLNNINRIASEQLYNVRNGRNKEVLVSVIITT